MNFLDSYEAAYGPDSDVGILTMPNHRGDEAWDVFGNATDDALKQINKQYQAAVKSINTQHDAVVKQIHAAYAAAIKSVPANYSAAVKQVTQQYNQALHALQSWYHGLNAANKRQSLSSYNNQLRALKQAETAAITQLNQQRSGINTQAKQQQASALATATSNWKAALKAASDAKTLATNTAKANTGVPMPTSGVPITPMPAPNPVLTPGPGPAPINPETISNPYTSPGYQPIVNAPGNPPNVPGLDQTGSPQFGPSQSGYYPTQASYDPSAGAPPSAYGPNPAYTTGYDPSGSDGNMTLYQPQGQPAGQSVQLNQTQKDIISQILELIANLLQALVGGGSAPRPASAAINVPSTSALLPNQRRTSPEVASALREQQSAAFTIPGADDAWDSGGGSAYGGYAAQVPVAIRARPRFRRLVSPIQAVNSMPVSVDQFGQWESVIAAVVSGASSVGSAAVAAALAPSAKIQAAPPPTIIQSPQASSTKTQASQGGLISGVSNTTLMLAGGAVAAVAIFSMAGKKGRK